jgi:hypothetical protein
VSLGRVAALMCRDRSKPDHRRRSARDRLRRPPRPFNPPGAHACAPGWAHSARRQGDAVGGRTRHVPLVSHLPEGPRLFLGSRTEHLERPELGSSSPRAPIAADHAVRMKCKSS